MRVLAWFFAINILGCKHVHYVVDVGGGIDGPNRSNDQEMEGSGHDA